MGKNIKTMRKGKKPKTKKKIKSNTYKREKIDKYNCLPNLRERCSKERSTNAQKFGKEFKRINQLVIDHSNIYIIPCEGKYKGKIYFIDEDHKEVKKHKKKFFHNCLISNTDAILSGEIIRLDKDTFTITNESGHYMPPPKHLNYIKKILNKNFKLISEKKNGIYKPFILGKGRGSEILGLKILTYKLSK